MTTLDGLKRAIEEHEKVARDGSGDSYIEALDSAWKSAFEWLVGWYERGMQIEENSGPIIDRRAEERREGMRLIAENLK